MILYHAISSYQLLEVILYQFRKNRNKKAVLILPDFILEKYPQYKKLEELNIFEKVFLFPYLQIPHRGEAEIVKDVERLYERTIPYGLEYFSEIYVAGAQFYFSLYLINSKKNFIFFEDAAGMLSRSDELYINLRVHFPIHAEIAKKYGLFDGSNEHITKIVCMKEAQTVELKKEHIENFCVEKELMRLWRKNRNKILKFFEIKKIKTKAQIIILTQQLANLGIMSEADQIQLYKEIRRKIMISDNKIIIKVHPDDTINYQKIFSEAEIIEQKFPAELLPYAFKKKPKILISYNSTAIENLRENFKCMYANEEGELLL